MSGPPLELEAEEAGLTETCQLLPVDAERPEARSRRPSAPGSGRLVQGAAALTAVLLVASALIAVHPGAGAPSGGERKQAAGLGGGRSGLVSEALQLPTVAHACSSFPACAGLEGDCCPNTKGYMLDCCSEPPPQPLIREPVDSLKPIKDLVKSCGTHPSCVFEGRIAGACCPDEHGEELPCCSKPLPTLKPLPVLSVPSVPPLPPVAQMPTIPTLPSLATPAPKQGTECARFPACVKAGLTQGACCPDRFNTTMACCPVRLGTECSSYPACVVAGFTSGACCPNQAGDYLDCCRKGAVTAANAPFESALCTEHFKCMEGGYTAGACCPDAAGTYLPCCGFKLHYDYQ